MWAGWYMENMPRVMSKVDPTVNKYLLTLPCPPTTELPLIDCTVDFGKFVAPILHDPDQFRYRQVLAATEYVTLEDIVAVYNQCKPASWKSAVYEGKEPESWVSILKNLSKLSCGAA